MLHQDQPILSAPTQATNLIAVLADGDNISFEAAGLFMSSVYALGTPTILRAYCDRLKPNGWDKDHRFQVTYLDALSGKNSADIRLVIDAMDIAHAGVVDSFVILSTDRDFAALAHRLRSVGYHVLGAGRSETSQSFKQACSEFHVLAPKCISAIALPVIEQLSKTETQTRPIPAITVKPATAPIASQFGKVEEAVQKIIREQGKDGKFPITGLNAAMRRAVPHFMISSSDEKNWRSYLTKRPKTFQCEEKGPEAAVRLLNP